MNENRSPFPADDPQASTGQIQRKQFDMAYASLSPSQKLDIYWPAEGSGPFPVIWQSHSTYVKIV